MRDLSVKQSIFMAHLKTRQTIRYLGVVFLNVAVDLLLPKESVHLGEHRPAVHLRLNIHEAAVNVGISIGTQLGCHLLVLTPAQP